LHRVWSTQGAMAGKETRGAHQRSQLRVRAWGLRSMPAKSSLDATRKRSAGLRDARDAPSKRRKIDGLSSTDLCEKDLGLLSRFEKAARAHVDRGELPGYAACVVQAGKLAYTSSYGHADLERSSPFNADTIVRLYCFTKTYVAVAVLMLAERGLLQLTDPVSKHIASFKHIRVVKNGTSIAKATPKVDASISKGLTIVRLLTHTGGLSYGTDFGNAPTDAVGKMYQPLVEAVERGEVSSLADYVDRLAALPLRRAPGKKLDYSVGLDVLGRVVEVVSGRSLDSFLKSEIFEPLGMKDTGFFVPKSKLSRLAALYGSEERASRMASLRGETLVRSKAKPKLFRLDGCRPSESWWAERKGARLLSGGGMIGHNMGGLVSTLRDQTRFFTMLLNGGVLGECRLLKAETVEEWCFQDVLPRQEVKGKIRRSGAGWSGWSSLGEVGKRRWKHDGPPMCDDYEEGEVGMGGAANTVWSVNPVRDQVTLWFSQSLDTDPWRGTGTQWSSPENFVTAARRLAPRRPREAAARRAHLARKPREGSA